MDDTLQTRTTAKPRRERHGFTLVEMLVVIAIIAVLAGLVTVVGGMAITRAKQTTIKMDITQLEMALNAYKEKYGDYPPDFAIDASNPDNTKAIVLGHLRIAFGNYIPSGTTTAAKWDSFRADVLAGCGFDVDELTPAEAMVFWLGGMPDGARGLAGFSADPTNPFRAGGSRTDPLFEFDQTRLIDDDGDGWPAYKSEHVRNDVPYVYFRVRTCPTHGEFEYELGGHAVLSWNAGNAGTCVPYFLAEQDSWNKPKTFQIISPGMDGLFGAARGGIPASDTGANFTDGDYDNITNFSSTTLEDGLE